MARRISSPEGTAMEPRHPVSVGNKRRFIWIHALWNAGRNLPLGKSR
jgi:hypothetical protein